MLMQNRNPKTNGSKINYMANFVQFFDRETGPQTQIGHNIMHNRTVMHFQIKS